MEGQQVRRQGGRGRRPSDRRPAVPPIPLCADRQGQAGGGIRQPAMRIHGRLLVESHLARDGLIYQLSLPVSICQYITQSARKENHGCENEAGLFFS
ncbi:hypothetical protein MASSI9I_50062 [Massilia sp. 9I]|nr:hypothetical protein MASSI9I_50062 [Massilia sp. 9I]